MAKEKMTLLRIRAYLKKCEKQGKTSTEIEALDWLMAGLDDASRIIQHLDLEIKAIRRLMEYARKQLDVEPMSVGIELMFKDSLMQMWEEQNRDMNDAIQKAQRQRIADQKAREPRIG